LTAIIKAPNLLVTAFATIENAMTIPFDAETRRAVAPVICYPTDTLPKPDLKTYRAARLDAQKIGEVVIPPREAGCFTVNSPSAPPYRAIFSDLFSRLMPGLSPVILGDWNDKEAFTDRLCAAQLVG
jgi:hypothetical protein